MHRKEFLIARWCFVIAGFCLLLIACARLPSIEQRTAAADTLALNAGFEKSLIPTDGFTLLVYGRFARTGQQGRQVSGNTTNNGVLRVYIEGDGLAFDQASKPTADPTPITPFALKLAIVDSSESVAYMARPCQYVMKSDGDKCTLRYWTSGRFSEPVIASMNQAINELKIRAHASKLELIGYSGGGAVASLLALRRDDVVQWVTVAGNLDHAFWTNKHHYTPLNYSLNAADFAVALSLIEQTHFVGGDDTNISPDVVDSYLSKMVNREKVTVKVIEGFDHACCWVKQWPELLKMLQSENHEVAKP